MKSIGDPVVRIDARARVTGAARYAYEWHVPGAAYAVLVTSDVARGRIVAIDTAAAERERGVLAVLTPFNAPRLPGAPQGDPPDRVVQVLQDEHVWFSN